MDTLNVQWNSVDKGVSAVVSNNGLTAMVPNNTNNVKATVGRKSGKWYWELTIDSVRNIMVGVCNEATPITSILYNTPNAKLYYNATGNKYQGAIAYGASFIAGDTISVALDMDVGKIEFYKNGINQGVAFSDLAQLGEVFPVIAGGATGTEDNRITANFGATPFKYPVPQGYFAYNVNIQEKMLLEKEGQGYSINTINQKHETKMTSNTAPSPLVASASGSYSSSYYPWKAFNGLNADSLSWATPADTISGWIQIDYGIPKVANVVYVSSRNTNQPSSSIKDFLILGSNDNSKFDTLATITNQTNWKQAETRKFTFQNDNSYRYYRCQVLSNNGFTYSDIGQLLYAQENTILTYTPDLSARSFIKYGQTEFNVSDNFNQVRHITKPQEIKKLNKKPLSIRLDQ